MHFQQNKTGILLNFFLCLPKCWLEPVDIISLTATSKVCKTLVCRSPHNLSAKSATKRGEAFFSRKSCADKRAGKRRERCEAEGQRGFIYSLLEWGWAHRAAASPGEHYNPSKRDMRSDLQSSLIPQTQAYKLSRIGRLQTLPPSLTHKERYDFFFQSAIRAKTCAKITWTCRHSSSVIHTHFESTLTSVFCVFEGNKLEMFC